MKGQKWMLLGIALILFGISAVLLAGLQGTPTYVNWIYELLGVLCPLAGLALVVAGCFGKG